MKTMTIILWESTKSQGVSFFNKRISMSKLLLEHCKLFSLNGRRTSNRHRPLIINIEYKGGIKKHMVTAVFRPNMKRV